MDQIQTPLEEFFKTQAGKNDESTSRLIFEKILIFSAQSQIVLEFLKQIDKLPREDLLLEPKNSPRWKKLNKYIVDLELLDSEITG